MKNKNSPLQQWIKKQNADINLADSKKRAADIIKTIRSRSGLSIEDTRTAVRQRAEQYDIIDIVQAAALQGIDYAEDHGTAVAEDLIKSNTISMVTKILDSIDEDTKKEQDREQI